MLRRAIGVFARISRLDTSLIIFLSLAVPLYLRQHDYRTALGRSVPLLAIAMCGFVLNDIHDAERDEENHPERPLPRKQLTPAHAAILYFLLLAFALSTLRMFVETRLVAVYLLLLIALINYNYVATFFPYLKNFYAAATGTIPLVILALTLGNHGISLTILAALFFFLVGREVLMDINDRRGDGDTLVKFIGPINSAWTGFALKIVGAGALLLVATGEWQRTLAAVILLLDAIFCIGWVAPHLHRIILQAMKAQLALGIAYVSIGMN